MVETQFALAYRGVVDAGLIGRMDMRVVNALAERLNMQIDAEAKQREKERKDAIARQREVIKAAKRRRL